MGKPHPRNIPHIRQVRSTFHDLDISGQLDSDLYDRRDPDHACQVGSARPGCFAHEI